MFKVLVISSAFPPMKSGESDYAWHLTRHLSQPGTEVSLLTTERSEIPRRPGLTVYPVMKSWHWKEVPRFLQFLRHHEFDQIVFLYIGWIYDNHPMATYIPALIKKVSPEQKLTTIFYNRIGAAQAYNSLPAQWGRKIFSFWAGPRDSCYEFGTLLTCSDRLIVFNQRHFAALASVDPRIQGKTILIPPPPLIEMTRNHAETRTAGRRVIGLRDEEIAVVFFGFIYQGKGLETLLEAFAMAQTILPKLRLVILGGTLDSSSPEKSSYVKNIKERVENSNRKNVLIHWLGGYEYDDIRPSQVLRGCDIAVLPFDNGVSLNNSSVASVLAHGLPLISTVFETLEKAFVDRDNIFLVPPKDPKRLARAIVEIAVKKDLSEKLVRGGEKLAALCFSWSRTTKEILGKDFQITDRRESDFAKPSASQSKEHAIS